MTDREALRQRLLATFKVEAREHTGTLTRALIELEQARSGDDSAGLIEQSFRAAHSLKGAARAVSLAAVETICQAMESVFSALKRGALPVSPELVDVLLGAVRTLDQLLSAAESGRSDATVPIARSLEALKAAVAAPALARGHQQPTQAQPPERAESAPTPRPTPPSVPREPVTATSDEVVRISTRKLDEVRLLAEELLSDKLGAAQLASELLSFRNELTSFAKQSLRLTANIGTRRSARASLEPCGDAEPDQSQRISELADFNKSSLDQLQQRASDLWRRAVQNQHSLTAKSDALLSESKELLMLPCSWLIEGLRPVVRDLSRDLGKDVELRVQGDAVELDRRILSGLKNPLVHALRNAIDHGVESSAERERAGKPSRASVSIEVGQVRSGHVAIRVMDDGRGIDPEQVKAAVLRLGVVEPRELERLDRQQTLELVFRSAVSTSQLVTDLSGRGLGLAIVRECVQRLGGSVSLESTVGAGTSLTFILPLSLATFRGLVVRAADHFYVVPTVNVARVLRVPRDRIRIVEERESVEVEGQPLSLVRLSRVLGVAARAERGEAPLPGMLLFSESTRMIFVVDEICTEQDVLVKRLGPELGRLDAVLGATQLPSGKIAPILDAAELIRRSLSGDAPGQSEPVRAEPSRRKSSILVAEDSITSRTLLKTILESAGFAVTTAVDGSDALAKLRMGDYDLVVSDVDMPRLNGFGLAQRIRADKRLMDLPIVLVTSLESREDRERGIEVGANAYIVKRSFEQSNLLEVVRRLL